MSEQGTVAMLLVILLLTNTNKIDVVQNDPQSEKKLNKKKDKINR